MSHGSPQRTEPLSLEAWVAAVASLPRPGSSWQSRVSGSCVPRVTNCLIHSGQRLLEGYRVSVSLSLLSAPGALSLLSRAHTFLWLLASCWGWGPRGWTGNARFRNGIGKLGERNLDKF